MGEAAAGPLVGRTVIRCDTAVSELSINGPEISLRGFGRQGYHSNTEIRRRRSSSSYSIPHRRVCRHITEELARTGIRDIAVSNASNLLDDISRKTGQPHALPLLGRKSRHGTRPFGELVYDDPARTTTLCVSATAIIN